MNRVDLEKKERYFLGLCRDEIKIAKSDGWIKEVEGFVEKLKVRCR